MKHYCHICYSETEPEFICEICDEYYCDQCSYIYTIHYQYQGSLCYECSVQNRLNKLDKNKIRENKLNYILDE